jgi:hypothetical protein
MPMYANMHTYTSIFKQDAIALSTQSSYCLETNIYSNISKLSEKPTDLSDETTYGKLINTTSITPLTNTDMAINSQILDENNNSRFYENISSHSTSIKMSKSSSSSTHIYINFDHQEDIPPIIPTSNNQQEDIHYSPLYPIEKKQADIETRSKTSTIKVSLTTLIERFNSEKENKNVTLSNIFRQLKNLESIWPRIVMIKVFHIIPRHHLLSHKFIDNDEHYIILNDDIVDVVQHLFGQLLIPMQCDDNNIQI